MIEACLLMNIPKDGSQAESEIMHGDADTWSTKLNAGKTDTNHHLLGHILNTPRNNHLTVTHLWAFSNLIKPLHQSKPSIHVSEFPFLSNNLTSGQFTITLSVIQTLAYLLTSETPHDKNPFDSSGGNFNHAA
jgi:hypothetical protein